MRLLETSWGRNNKLIGNGVANQLMGGGGTDILEGGQGIDTSLFKGTRGQFHPASGAERSGSRLLDGRGRRRSTAPFRELPALLDAGDLLVFNDTRSSRRAVRRKGQRRQAWSCWWSACCPAHEVVAHMKVSKKPQVGTRWRLGAPAASAPRCWGAGPAPTARCFTCASAATRWR
jgi:hypothetical protein